MNADNKAISPHPHQGLGKDINRCRLLNLYVNDDEFISGQGQPKPSSSSKG